MKKKQFLQNSLIATFFLVTGNIFAQQNDWSEVEKVFGKKGNVQGDVFKITFPRSDLKVKVGDFAVAPGLALTSWIGIMKMGNEAMIMGNLVLLDFETAKVASKLVSSNLKYNIYTQSPYK